MELDIGKSMARQILTESRVIYSHFKVGTDNKPISFGNGNLPHKTRLRWENTLYLREKVELNFILPYFVLSSRII